MNEIQVYFIGIAIMVIISVIVVWYINKRLRNILVDLTQKKERAYFWLRYINVLLIGVPLIFSMTIYPESLFEITSQIKWGMVGLVLSLTLLGIIMVIYISKNVENERNERVK